MKKVCKGLWNRCVCNLRAGFRRIHLIDKFLILFMVVLLGQSVFNIFNQHPESNQTTTIDVIIRTSCAAIFGYFLSANFIGGAQTGKKREGTPGGTAITLPPGPDAAAKGHIGFTAGAEPTGELEQGKAVSVKNIGRTPLTANRLQVFVAVGVGMFCLVALIIIRNSAGANPEWLDNPAIAATIAQFRDFISGCVGFLIGSPTTRQEEDEKDV